MQDQGSQTILLTGATGAVGTELLPRLLRRNPQARIIALVRGADQAEAESRLAATLAFSDTAPAERARVHALRGDVCAPALGLDTDTLRGLAAQTSQIFHLAANVRFNAGLEDSRLANVGSTRAILDFARQAHAARDGALRLQYVSTAYVAGRRLGPLHEHELDLGQSFWNTYEQTKLEAEAVVRQAQAELPITIYRPSQIIGTTAAGKVRKLFGFLEFLKLTCAGVIRALPAHPETRTDMIPVDYVCDAIAYLSGEPDSVGRCYHLAAGLAHSTPLGRVVDIAYRVLEEYAPPSRLPPRPDFVPIDLFERQANDGQVHKSLNGLLQLYQTYMSYERDFQVADTMARLARGGVTLAPMDEVVEAGARYVVAQHFGTAARAAA
ncbi:NAD-dependent epimerase/dehydratase family protein [Azoarcus sp. TTM-91]|uniref:SDR family oxidoreductase n=1 Tax=Azoarcus sp. TTM-91 TaxID=2691581 RepID=UPI00145C5D74|nr:SDR family oxidoreductase [Azoarcus sp. TTM-91]NMG34456.1 NAD-dependent epimerase/dehydratase family protein [Azoarcus sp. TTM-91]